LRKGLLRLNHSLITPLVSFFGPEAAYRAIPYIANIGKSYRKGSFRFRSDVFSSAREYWMRYLDKAPREAEKVMDRFFCIENRVLLEHIWLARNKLHYLPRIINMEKIRELADIINQRGPLLLLSAHTAYYFIIPWALHAQGAKIAYVLSDPRAAEKHVLSGSDTVAALNRLIPLVFTNKGNTVSKSLDLLRKGFSVFMLIDVPGYKGRGQTVNLFGDELWLPPGCMLMFKEAQPVVYSVFAYLTDIAQPYEVTLSPVPADTAGIRLQAWADHLEKTVRMSPESWLGWFYLSGMK
jgi:lauroyl/myristoyl acyltransferase